MDRKGDISPLVWMTIALAAGIVMLIILRTVMCLTKTWPWGC